MYPPVAHTADRQVKEGYMVVEGYRLPEGTQVGVAMVAMTRGGELWAPNGAVFRPDRWIEAAGDEDRFKEMCGVVDLVFGHGKYTCLGKDIAWMELNKVLVEVSAPENELADVPTDFLLKLVRRYDFILAGGFHEPLKLIDCGLWMIHDFNVKVAKRPA